MTPALTRSLLALSLSLTLAACRFNPPVAIDPTPAPPGIGGIVTKEVAISKIQQDLGMGYVRPGALDENKRSIVLNLVTDGVIPAEIRWVDKDKRGTFSTDSATGTTWRVLADGDYVENITCIWRDAQLRVHQVSTTLQISNSLIKASTQKPVLSVSPSKLWLVKPPSAAVAAKLGLDLQKLAGRAEIRLFRADQGEDTSANLPVVWKADNDALQVTPAPGNRTITVAPMLSALTGTISVQLAGDANLKAEIPVEVRPLGVDLLQDKLIAYVPPAGAKPVAVRVVYSSPWDGTELLSDTSGSGLRWTSDDPQRLKVDPDGQMRWLAASGPAPVRVTVALEDGSGKAVSLEIYGDEQAWRVRQGLAPAKATIEGLVADADGKPLPGATVMLTVQGGRQQTLTADAAGRYRFDDLTVGASVLVKAGLSGYTTTARQLVVSSATEKVEFTGVTALTFEGLTTPTTATPTPAPTATPTPTPTPLPPSSDVTGSPTPLSTPVPLPSPLATPVPLPPSPFNITAFAGNGTGAFAGDGSNALAASFHGPYGLTVANGNTYVADTLNHRLRMIAPGGATVTTIAGTGAPDATGDGGAAASAAIGSPFDVAVDGAGNVYFTDPLHHVVRRVAAGGMITTIAGNGLSGTPGEGATATAVSLRSPYGIAVDGAGNVFVADAGNHRVYKVAANGTISTFAGTGTAGFSGDGGQATSTALSWPQGLAIDGSGNLYVADWGNQRVRRISAAGVITTVAGNGTLGFAGDGGPATAASLNGPYGVAVDGSGSLVISDGGNQRVRLVGADGMISTIAGNGTAGYGGDGGSGELAALDGPAGVAFSGTDVLVVDHYNDRIRRLSRR